jgi:hypothetical protein
MKPTVILRLTTSQRMALTDVLLSYIRLSDQPQEFLDVVNDITTTAGDLLRLVLSSSVEEQRT